MLRNYLMPGFALVLLAVFASPRSIPPGTESGGRGVQTEPSPRGTNTPRAARPSKVPQLEGSKQLFNPESICSVAKYEMHEKLAEFGVDFPEPDETGKFATAKASGAAESEIPPAEAMIALLPDPVHTQFALRFDRYIDVLQQALQDSTSESSPGWVYVSQWLPWDPVPFQASQDPIDRTNVHMFDADRECAPGILIFRKNGYQAGNVRGKFLIVFLVGESPTSGILHHNQFLYAMQSWHTIQLRTEAQAREEAAKTGNQGKETADTAHPDGTLRILD